MALSGPFGVRGPNSGGGDGQTKKLPADNSFATALAQISKAVTGAGTGATAASPSFGIRAPQGNMAFENTTLDNLAQLNLQNLAQSGMVPSRAIGQMNAVVGPSSNVTPMEAGAPSIAHKFYNQAGATGSPGANTPSNLGTNQAKTKFGQYVSQNADFNSMLQNPEQISRAYYDFNKMPTHSGGEAMLNNIAPSLPLMYTLMQGQGSGQNMSNANMMDWMGQYIDQTNRPGAKGIGPADVAKALFTRDPNSIVFNQLYGSDLTPTQQVGNFISAMRYGLAPSVSAPMLNSMLARVSDLGNDFITWRNTHADGGYTFGQYLNQKGFGPQAFGAK